MCKKCEIDDDFANAIQPLGFNVTLLPKADIQPLEIITRAGHDLYRQGAMTKLLTAGPKVKSPAIKSDKPTAPINGLRTKDIRIGIGLTILRGIVGAMGGSSLGFEKEYKQAQYGVFEFRNVKEDRIEIGELDQYLDKADIDPANDSASQLLDADLIYITTGILKSTQFTFEARSDSGDGVSVNIGAIQQQVGGKVKVTANSGTSTKVTYEGKIPLIFAFQAAQLYYVRGGYRVIKSVETSTTKGIENVSRTGPEYLMMNRDFVKLHS